MSNSVINIKPHNNLVINTKPKNKGLRDITTIYFDSSTISVGQPMLLWMITYPININQLGPRA